MNKDSDDLNQNDSIPNKNIIVSITKCDFKNYYIIQKSKVENYN